MRERGGAPARLLPFRAEFGAAVPEFLTRCLPQSGRRFDPQGWHRAFYDIPHSFERFWCLFEGRTLIGTVAYRPLAGGCCELKALYLDRAYQGRGLGLRMLQTAMEAARAAGYREMRLETLSGSVRAIALYRRAGFSPIPRYREDTKADVFLARPLAVRQGGEGGE